MGKLSFITKGFEKFKLFTAKHYGDGPGNLVIFTGAIGWILSSAAQMFAITINDKIPKEQKLFMLPQEFADACVNILSFLLITKTCQKAMLKAIWKGKILSKSAAEFLEKNKLWGEVASHGTDSVLKKHASEDVYNTFKGTKDGLDIVATTVGTVLSCNVVTPILRNMYASNRQSVKLAYLSEKQKQAQDKYLYEHRVSMDNYKTQTFKGCVRGLKI